MRIHCLFFVFFLWVFTAASQAFSADPSDASAPSGTVVERTDVTMSVKGPVVVDYDWTGPYIGAHLGYLWGSSDWSAHGTGGGGPLTGSLDFFKGFDFSKGTGSFFGGFEAGYNYMLPSRLVFGAEADVSFPNSIRGSQRFSSPAVDQESFTDTVEYSGTMRGRIGYALNKWLLYGTGGFVWSFDQFSRAQLARTPLGETAIAGTTELAKRWRTGWTLGAGVEFAFAPNWTARFEYLFTDFGASSITFPAGAQQFRSDLAVHETRLGLNYKFGDATSNVPAPEPAAPESNNWSIRSQSTYLNQYAPGFREPYRGPNSLISKSGRETWDATLYAGVRLWQGAEFWVNPEIDQGFGLSETLGVAGFPSGEAYKVGANYPYARLQRMFIRQTLGLGDEIEKSESAVNQFDGSRPANRLVLTFGKFAVPDIFDANKYAHDARKDFMNWSLIDTGTFDYAADAWGYTYGTALEWYQDHWALRCGVFDLSIVPNSMRLDPRFDQFQLVFEIERRHDLWGEPGKIALTEFLSRGRMGRYNDAVRFAQLMGGPADIAAVRRYTSRGGIGVNVEQQVLTDLGLFARAGLASGDVEPYEFTDIDRTIAAGLSLSGKLWTRPDDTVGIAGVVNGISTAHRVFLNAGGLGILVSDGRLPHPSREYIVEAYYNVHIWREVSATVDLQRIVNPGYNRDRGPVWIPGFRLHAEF